MRRFLPSSTFLGKHKTSVSLEDEFWAGLKETGNQRTCGRRFKAVTFW